VVTENDSDVADFVSEIEILLCLRTRVQYGQEHGLMLSGNGGSRDRHKGKGSGFVVAIV